MLASGDVVDAVSSGWFLSSSGVYECLIKGRNPDNEECRCRDRFSSTIVIHSCCVLYEQPLSCAVRQKKRYLSLSSLT